MKLVAQDTVLFNDTIRANIAYGMARPDLRDGLREDMQKYLET